MPNCSLGKAPLRATIAALQEIVFTAPLHNNGSYSIVACVFVSAEMFTESLPNNERLF
jgi:hypothetical protein